MAKYKGTNPTDIALHELKDMRHRDIQRACVIRGMPFEDVIKLSDPRLSNWFIQNYVATQIPALLDAFDDYKDNEIRKYQEGKGEKFQPVHPNLRLGYIGEVNEDTGKVTIKRPKGVKKPKKAKRERDAETKLFTGTKKALTYKLTKEKMAIVDIIKEVTKQFPEAKEKSIKIWAKRCLKSK